MSTQTLVDPDSKDASAVTRRTAARLTYAAAGATAISAMLPWVSVAGLFSVHMPTAGVLVLLALAAGYGLAARRVEGGASGLGLAWLVNLALGSLIVVIYAKLSETEGIAGPSTGVFAAVLGVCLGVAGAIRIKRARG